jgi:hypothetical protein
VRLWAGEASRIDPWAPHDNCKEPRGGYSKGGEERGEGQSKRQAQIKRIEGNLE